MANPKTSRISINVGVDIGKFYLDVYLHEKKKYFQVDNTGPGIRELLRKLSYYQIERVVMEATGRYEFALAEACYAKGLPVVIAKPISIRRYAGAIDQLAKTDKLDFHVAVGMNYSLEVGNDIIEAPAQSKEKNKYLASTSSVYVPQGEELVVKKYAAIISSENHPKDDLIEVCKSELSRITSKGFDIMLKEQQAAWELKWEESDIKIEGDVSAQQGIRFNIFQLNQT